jgi:hypothetical protein
MSIESIIVRRAKIPVRWRRISIAGHCASRQSTQRIYVFTPNGLMHGKMELFSSYFINANSAKIR